MLRWRARVRPDSGNSNGTDGAAGTALDEALCLPRPIGGGERAERSERSHLLCDAVVDIAAALFSVSADDLRRQGRTTRRIARVRQIAMYCAHTVLGLSQREVGRAFGLDRTTVLHACHTVEDLRDEEPFEETVRLFEAILLAAFRTRAGEPAR